MGSGTSPNKSTISARKRLGVVVSQQWNRPAFTCTAWINPAGGRPDLCDRAALQPSRCFVWDGFAYAAVAFSEGSAVAQQSAFQRFVENHYSADWNNDWEQAFRLIYSTAPRVQQRNSAAGAVTLHIPWSNDEQLKAVLVDRSHRSNPFTRLRSLLDQLGSRVSKNLTDFQAFALSVTYLEHIYWREEIISRKPPSREEAASLFANIRDRDRALAEALTSDWDRGRFSDSAAKSTPLYGFEPKDQVLFQFQRAADYSASLASNPDRFFQLLTS